LAQGKTCLRICNRRAIVAAAPHFIDICLGDAFHCLATNVGRHRAAGETLT